MAKLNYEHVFASAGFSGENWDITQGHNQSFDSSGDANDVTFTAATSKITLSAGTFPAWMQVVGAEFSTDSGTNPGPFTITVVNSNQDIEVSPAPADEEGVDVVFDGSPDTDIQDVLLKTGNGAMETDAPHALVSTGALGAPRTLALDNMEAENAAQGSAALDGRFFYLSIQNSDISSTNSITLSGSSTINGAASYVIETTGDYLVHHISGGVWRINVLPTPGEVTATMKRIPFAAADWAAGTNNEITCIPSGAPGAGQIGPHTLTVAGSYVVQIVNTDQTPDEIVDAEVQFDASGNITILKAGLGPAFNGVMLIVGTLD